LLLVLLVLAGCTGMTRHRRRDAVVTARQIALRGMDALEAGHLDEAERYFAEAVETCPVDERVRRRYAEALWRRGEGASAIEHMREAARLSGGEPEVLVRLGEMQLAQGQLPQALHLADRAIRSGRASAAAHRLRGDTLARQSPNRWREALACYHRALAIDDGCPRVQLAAAELYLRNGRPRRALATLQRLSRQHAAEQLPLELLHMQGIAYKAVQRYDRSIECLNRLLARQPQNLDALYELADAHYCRGDPDEARRVVRHILDQEPQHIAARQLGERLQMGPRVAGAPE
jgi:tetratricopeptide (TPR) repeat protein